MSLSKIDELHYLWDDPKSGWVLIHLNSDSPSEEPYYGIYNLRTRRGLIIEDPDEAVEAKRRMLAAGTRIIKSLAGIV